MLQTDAEYYNKGILADITEFVMGNGLISADNELWKIRRRLIGPSMHKKFLAKMGDTFTDAMTCGLDILEQSAAKGEH